MHLHLEGDYNMDKFKIKDRIDELKTAEEHGKVVMKKTNDPQKAAAAALRRYLRIEKRSEEKARNQPMEREDSHTVYEYIGAILAESLGLVEAVKLSSQYKGREVRHIFTGNRPGRQGTVTYQSRTKQEPAVTATTSTGKQYSGQRAADYMNRLMDRRTISPEKKRAAEEEDRQHRERRNTSRDPKSSQTGRNMSGFGLRRGRR